MGQITLSTTGQVAVITIDNPPLNALSRPLVEELSQTLDVIAKGTARAVVITGAGEKSFVAGADIAQFPALDDASGMDLVRHGQAVYRKIAALDRPVICAVNGFALGGGCELALACDIRVAAENAKFGLPEVGLGIVPGYGGTQRLPRLVGAGMAMKLIFTAKPISAQEAYRIGLCEVLTPQGQALETALELAEQMAAAAPRAISEAKQLVHNGAALSLDDAIDQEAQAFGRLCLTADKNEGVAAFFEKRKAVFSGN